MQYAFLLSSTSCSASTNVTITSIIEMILEISTILPLISNVFTLLLGHWYVHDAENVLRFTRFRILLHSLQCLNLLLRWHVSISFGHCSSSSVSLSMFQAYNLGINWFSDTSTNSSSSAIVCSPELVDTEAISSLCIQNGNSRHNSYRLSLDLILHHLDFLLVSEDCLSFCLHQSCKLLLLNQTEPLLICFF